LKVHNCSLTIFFLPYIPVDCGCADKQQQMNTFSKSFGLKVPDSEMSYCKISKVMSSLHFVLDVFCQFKTRVPGFDGVFSVQCALYSAQLLGVGEGLRVKFWDSSLH
jgi:hypothetical protein